MRRRSAGPPVSFFSFQDIMTGVIGVMILIILILVLWLTEVVEGVEAYVASGTTQEPEELLLLRRKVVELEEQFARQKMAAESIAATAEVRPDRRLAQLRFTLGTLYDNIERRKQEITDKTTEMRTTVEREHLADSKTAQARHLQQQLGQLHATLEEKRRSDRLVYIASQSFALQPLLIEISGEAIKFSGATDADAVVEFTDEERALRLERALAWVEGFSKDKFYCLLLLKPSGLPLYEQLHDELEQRGFQIGIELLPERFSASMDTTFGE